MSDGNYRMGYRQHGLRSWFTAQVNKSFRYLKHLISFEQKRYMYPLCLYLNIYLLTFALKHSMNEVFEYKFNCWIHLIELIGMMNTERELLRLHFGEGFIAPAAGNAISKFSAVGLFREPQLQKGIFPPNHAFLGGGMVKCMHQLGQITIIRYLVKIYS